MIVRPRRFIFELKEITLLDRKLWMAFGFAGLSFTMPGQVLSEELTYYGHIDRYPVSMTIDVSQNGRAQGFYSYDRYNHRLNLDGELSGGSIQLSVQGSSEHSKEVFEGHYTSREERHGWRSPGDLSDLPVRLSGTWSSGNKRLAFELELEPYGDGLLTCDEMRGKTELVFNRMEAPDLGSGHGSPLDVEYGCRESLAELDFLQQLYKMSDVLNGDSRDGQLCRGSIVYAKSRYFAFSLLEAGFAPSLEPREASWHSPATSDTLEYLRYWSVQSLFNRSYYLQYMRVLEDAELELARHYADTFDLMPEEAAVAARNGIYLFLRKAAGAAPEAARTPSSLVAYLLNAQTDPAALNQRLGEVSPSDVTEALSVALLLEKSDETIEQILAFVSDINQGDESPLFASLNNPDHLRVVLAHGADVDYQNGFGKTALYYAIQFNLHEAVRTLIAAGADVNHRYKSAEELNRLDMGCRYNIQRTLRTPLMHAAQHSDLAMLRLLLDAGANINDVDGLGDTAATYAEVNGQTDNADFLTNHATSLGSP